MTSNLTFDDGEPLDIAKLQKLYGTILDVQSKANAASTLASQGFREIPKVFSSSVTNVTVTSKLNKIDIDYSKMGLDSGVTPRIVVTPRGTSDGIIDVKYFVTEVGSSKAKIAHQAPKQVICAFDYVVVYMQPTTA